MKKINFRFLMKFRKSQAASLKRRFLQWLGSGVQIGTSYSVLDANGNKISENMEVYMDGIVWAAEQRRTTIERELINSITHESLHSAITILEQHFGRELEEEFVAKMSAELAPFHA